MSLRERRKLITIITILAEVIIATPLTVYYLNNSSEPLPVISVTDGNETYHLTGDFVNNSTWHSNSATQIFNDSSTTRITEADNSASTLTIVMNAAAADYDRAEGPNLEIWVNLTIEGNLSINLRPTDLELGINSSGPDANDSGLDQVSWLDGRQITNLSEMTGDSLGYAGYSSLTEKWNLLNESSPQKINQTGRYHFESWASQMRALVGSPLVPNKPFYFHFHLELEGLQKPVFTDLYLEVLNN